MASAMCGNVSAKSDKMHGQSPRYGFAREQMAAFASAALYAGSVVRIRLLAFAVIGSTIPWNEAAAQEGAIARCGASSGQGYFFWDELTNPDGPNWDDDAISNGKIVLIRLGDEWDIQFDDVAGASGYRQDGATVLVLGDNGTKLVVGAFRGTYSDVYTFDFTGRSVTWTSHKLGPIVAKVAIYQAECSWMAR